jgi:hypothetical protein
LFFAAVVVVCDVFVSPFFSRLTEHQRDAPGTRHCEWVNDLKQFSDALHRLAVQNLENPALHSSGGASRRARRRYATPSIPPAATHREVATTDPEKLSPMTASWMTNITAASRTKIPMYW